MGIDEAGYIPVGVGNPDQLQRDLAEAASNLEPPVRLTFTAHFLDGKIALAVEVPEVEPQFRPCYLRARGPYHGAYIRVGDGERQMSEYEVYLALSSRLQPMEDTRAVEGASIEDLEESRLEAFLTLMLSKHPGLAKVAGGREGLLRALNIVSPKDPSQPTFAGLVTFGRYPQMLFPSLVITVTAYSSDKPDTASRLEADIRCETNRPKVRKWKSDHQFRESLAPPGVTFQISLNHHLDNVIELDLRLPTQCSLSLGRITDQDIDLGRPDEALVDNQIVLPVEAGGVKTLIHPFPD